MAKWEWDKKLKRYRETDTGRIIGQRRMVKLRDVYNESVADEVAELADKLGTGDLTVQQWTIAMRDRIKKTFSDQYVLARGGRNSMTQRDWGRVGRMVKDQYHFLQGFARDVADGKMSVKQVAARAKMYMDSSTQAFERGKESSYGIPTLPEYPADGSQDCLSNCKCTWSIRETKTAWEATWVLDAAAEHCDTCIDNAAKWAPLVIEKSEARNISEVKNILDTKDNHHHGHAHK